MISVDGVCKNCSVEAVFVGLSVNYVRLDGNSLTLCGYHDERQNKTGVTQLVNHRHSFFASIKMNIETKVYEIARKKGG